MFCGQIGCINGMSNNSGMSQSNSSDSLARPPTSTRTSARTFRTFVVGMVVGAILVIVLLTLVALPLSLTHRTEFPLEGTFGHMAVNLVSSLNAGNAGNPLEKNDKTLTDGGDLYNTNCSSCHGDHGDAKDAKGKLIGGNYPPPADLTSANTQGKSDAQLYWIIKHGLSFTAMAAYPDFSDNQLWSIVTYIRSLKK